MGLAGVPHVAAVRVGAQAQQTEDAAAAEVAENTMELVAALYAQAYAKHGWNRPRRNTCHPHHRRRYRKRLRQKIPF